MDEMQIDRVEVERVDRKVIEGRLLESLDDGAHVAIVLGKDELRTLIGVLDHFTFAPATVPDDRWKRAYQMHKDLTQLHKEAFGCESSSKMAS